MKKVSIALLLTGLLGGFSGLAGAQAANERPSLAAADAPTAVDLTDGEIRKVDKAAGKLTIKHGPIKNLDMPGMTMVFQVRDAALLDQVQTGDKLRFRAENEGGRFLVTEIRPVN